MNRKLLAAIACATLLAACNNETAHEEAPSSVDTTMTETPAPMAPSTTQMDSVEMSTGTSANATTSDQMGSGNNSYMGDSTPLGGPQHGQVTVKPSKPHRR